MLVNTLTNVDKQNLIVKCYLWMLWAVFPKRNSKQECLSVILSH